MPCRGTLSCKTHSEFEKKQVGGRSKNFWTDLQSGGVKPIPVILNYTSIDLYSKLAEAKAEVAKAEVAKPKDIYDPD
jgi:hypothetical protein